MNVFIIEDETAAYENLVEILNETDPSVKVIGNAESILQAVARLQSAVVPDLILMDIHLSDGSAFSIFEHIEIETPIIFTTAYDEYAIEAFKVNSIDYLLKPVKVDEMRRALNKYRKFTQNDLAGHLQKLAAITATSGYKDKLLLPVKDRLLPIRTEDISCFFTTDKQTKIYLADGSCYAYAKTLDQIISSLDPVCFIRANKQFIVSRNSVKNITIWFDSRLLVTLDIETPERIYVSKNKASEFKAWMVKESK